jgi:hypothetical protein|tara:strand:- start:1858 stop:2346 length:489 start_codon:yes stop_codon:yes gene_type:complete
MSEHKNIRLDGVELQWAKLHEPSDLSNKYTVNVIKLTDAQVKELKAAGITVKNGKDKKEPNLEVGNYIAPSAQNPVMVVDSMKKSIEGEELARIGNGTIANVIVRPYDWTFKNKKGVGCGLQGIQIVELKEYRGAADMFEKQDGGYVQPALAQAVAEDDVAF